MLEVFMELIGQVERSFFIGLFVSPALNRSQQLARHTCHFLWNFQSESLHHLEFAHVDCLGVNSVQDSSSLT